MNSIHQQRDADAESRVQASATCFERGDLLGALSLLDEALVIFPRNGSVQANRCLVLARLGRITQALDAGFAAVALEPRLAGGHLQLGSALRQVGRIDEALHHLDLALALEPTAAEALIVRGLTLQESGHLQAAIDAYREATKRRPELAEAWCNIGICLQSSGEPDLAAAAFRQAMKLRPGYTDACSNLLMGLQYDPAATSETLRRSAGDWQRVWIEQQKTQPQPATPIRPMSEPRRSPLRIAYISADFRAHPVGWFVADLLKAHDRSRVEVHCYAVQQVRDTVTERLMDAADYWHEALGLSDGALVERIQADGIDVLVDLSGHTAGNRLGAFAQRAAPVQVSWLGYFASTGVTTMDKVIIGADQAPAGAEDFFTEPLIRLSRCQFCWSPPEHAPEPALRRASETPVFGSFNNTAKLNDQVLELWAALMRRVPNARLILKWKTFNDPMLRDRVLRYMTAAGVDAERIELRGASAHLDMLREYGDLDVALDPCPFSGALTTCEALWMGVPVVTLAGQRPVSRQSLSILRAIGLEDCCADTPDRYLDIAASLAVDQGRLRQLRHGLRARIKASHLRDGVSLAHALENSFESLDAERRQRGQQTVV